ncbi:hypothetical protein H6G17_24435 [Chroococcidiopsis sp. FACHB-1243]|nr:hypothetical protein [Chroococcidiopsis sp. [FACHB-1243]]MBD2308623.1 hypothetical protein [Chroococcidiopsis sp. [FACHB-1243]]
MFEDKATNYSCSINVRGDRQEFVGEKEVMLLRSFCWNNLDLFIVTL